MEWGDLRGWFASNRRDIEEVLVVNASSSAIGRGETELEEVVGKRAGAGAWASTSISANPSEENLHVASAFTIFSAITDIDAAVVGDTDGIRATEGLTGLVALVLLCTLTFTTTVNPSQCCHITTIHLYH